MCLSACPCIHTAYSTCIIPLLPCPHSIRYIYIRSMHIVHALKQDSSASVLLPLALSVKGREQCSLPTTINSELLLTHVGEIFEFVCNLHQHWPDFEHLDIRLASVSLTCCTFLISTQALAKMYSSGITTMSKQFTFQFEEDMVYLDIKRGGVILKNGWKIIPMHSPQVHLLTLRCHGLELVSRMYSS